MQVFKLCINYDHLFVNYARNYELTNKLTETSGLLLLSFGTSRLVLLVDPSAFVSVTSRLFALLVQIAELTPRVEIVPERVELVELVERDRLVAELGHRFSDRPARVSLERIAKHLVKVLLIRLGHRRDDLVERRVDRVVGFALHWIGEQLECFRDAREYVSFLRARFFHLVRMIF